MFDKKPRTLPLLEVIVLTSFVLFMFWLLHMRQEEPVSDNVDVLIGRYRLLRQDNLSMEQPPYRTEELSADDWHQLINLTDFTFTMNDPAMLCNVSPIVLAVVHSAPRHFSFRKAIRSTWGSDLHVVFLIGETDNVTQQKIFDENTKYKDIIQGSFIDSYRNLTYKHIMGLKWVTYYCRTARYILKLDDDVFVNSRKLHDLIIGQLSPLGARNLVLCKVMESCAVKRTYRSKWRVTPAEYAGRWYPNYCPGWAVLYSPDAVFALYREAQRTPYFWIDDVHVTGTLVAQANLSHTTIGSAQRYLWASSEEHLINHRSDFIVGLTSYPDFYDIWQTLIS